VRASDCSPYPPLGRRFNWRMNLTRSFAAEQFARGLESWQWISIGSKVPLFASPFGDVFFRADDGIWWRDTLGLAFGAESRGLIPDGGQVYGFKTPPVLG